MVSKRPILAVFFTILLLMLNVTPAWATTYTAPAPAYVFTSSSNTTVTDPNFMEADSSGQNLSYITDIHVSWSLQSGDSVAVLWYDGSFNLIGTANLSASPLSATGIEVLPPGGAYSAKLQLSSSSSAGNRFFWWADLTNSAGNTTVFPAPSGVSSGSGAIASPVMDFQPVIDAINSLGTQLTGISGQLTGVSSQLSGISNQLTGVSGQLSAITGQLSGINSTLNNLTGYITTPRQSTPLAFGALSPQPTFDPTPPTIPDAPQAPYTYDKPIPQMPAFVDTPQPLPSMPDPAQSIMPHDPPITKDSPAILNIPLSPQQPAIQNNPTLPDQPLSPDAPLQQQPYTPQPPIPQQGYTPQPPLPQQGYAPQQPISSSAPYSAQTPLQSQPPLTPKAPLIP